MSNIKSVLKYAVSLGLIGWFLHSSNTVEIVDSLLSLGPGSAVGLAVIYFLSIFVNTYRWQMLLPSYTMRTLFSLNLIGQYYTMILPGQMAGEAVKAFKLGKGKKDAELIAASVVIDKLTGLLGLLVVGLVGLFFSMKSQAASFFGVFTVAFLLLIIILAGLRLKFADKIVRSLFLKLSICLIRFQPIFEQFVRLLDAWQKYLNMPFVLFASFILGIISHFLTVLMIYLLAGSMGIALPVPEWCWIYAVVSIVIIIPVTIGGAGLREGSLIFTLAWFNTPKEKALALSFAILGIVILLSVLPGVLLDWVSPDFSGHKKEDKEL